MATRRIGQGSSSSSSIKIVNGDTGSTRSSDSSIEILESFSKVTLKQKTTSGMKAAVDPAALPRIVHIVEDARYNGVASQEGKLQTVRGIKRASLTSSRHASATPSPSAAKCDGSFLENKEEKTSVVNGGGSASSRNSRGRFRPTKQLGFKSGLDNGNKSRVNGEAVISNHGSGTSRHRRERHRGDNFSENSSQQLDIEEELVNENPGRESAEDSETADSADAVPLPANTQEKESLDMPKFADPYELFGTDAETINERQRWEPTTYTPEVCAKYTRLDINEIAKRETQQQIATYQQLCRSDKKYVHDLVKTIDKIDQTANRLVWAMCAAHNDNNEMIMCFLKQCDPNEDSQQFACLAPHMAAQHGNLVALLLMREAGADFDIKDADQKTPLFHAIAHGHYPAVLFLLNSGASVNAQDKVGDTPLHVAMYTRPEQFYRNTKLRSTDERVALSSKIRSLIIKELLEADANPNIRNHEELTPLLLLMVLPHVDKDCIRTFFNHQTAQLPIDPNVQGPLGMTALHIAARYARPTDARSLAAFSSTYAESSSPAWIDPLSPRGAPQTPTLTESHQHLLAASALLSDSSESAEARHDREKLIEWIKRSSCDVNARDRMGRTALHVALYDRPSSHLNVLVLVALAAHGCEVTSVCEEGYAGFDLLSHFGEERCSAIRKALFDANDEHVKLIRAGKRPSAYDFSRGLSFFPMPVYNRLRYNDKPTPKPNSKTVETESENEPSFVFIQAVPATDELKLAHATLYFQEHLELVEFLSCNCGRDASCSFIDCDTCLISALHPQTSSLARGARLVARDPHRKLSEAIRRQVNGYKGSRELDAQRAAEWKKLEHQQHEQEILDATGIAGGSSGDYFRMSDVRWYKQLDAEHQRRFGAEVEARTNSRQFHYTCDGRLRAFAETNTLPAHMQPMSTLNFDEIIMSMWEEYVEQLGEESGKEPRIVRGADRIVGSGDSCNKVSNLGVASSSSSIGSTAAGNDCCVRFSADDAKNMRMLKTVYADVQEENDPAAANVLADWMLRDIVLDVPKQPFFIRECNSLCLCSGRCTNRLTQRRDAEAELRIERCRKSEHIDCSSTNFGAITLDFETLTDRLLYTLREHDEENDDDEEDDETLLQKLSGTHQDVVAVHEENRSRRAGQRVEGGDADEQQHGDNADDKAEADRSDRISKAVKETVGKSRVGGSAGGSQRSGDVHRVALKGNRTETTSQSSKSGGQSRCVSSEMDEFPRSSAGSSVGDEEDMQVIDEADDADGVDADDDDVNSPQTPTIPPLESAGGDPGQSMTSSHAGGSGSASSGTSRIRLQTEGWMVKSVKPLKPGQFICFYAGIVRHARQDKDAAQKFKSAVSKMAPSLKKRLIPLDASRDLIIDNSFYGNASRLFLMSEQHANVEAVPVFHDVAPFPKVAFFAKRWIFPHEPLVFDPELTANRFAQDWPRTLMAEALRIRRLYPFYLRDKDVRILKDQARWNRLVPNNMANIADADDADQHKATSKGVADQTAPFAIPSNPLTTQLNLDKHRRAPPTATVDDDDDDVIVLEENDDEGVDVSGRR